MSGISSGYATEQQAKQTCSQRMGLPYPAPLPETQAYFDCWNNEKTKSSNQTQGIIADIFDIGAGLFGKSNQQQYQYGTMPYYIPPQPTVLGMPPAMGYLVVLAGVAGIGYLIYKSVK